MSWLLPCFTRTSLSKESKSGEKEEKADNKADLKFAQCDKTNFY